MWVCRLTPNDMHAEVCRRLRDRWELIREAFMATMDDSERLTLPPFLQFLERLTIDDVVLDLGPEQQIPLLSESGPRDIRWKHPSEELVLFSERHPYSVPNLRVRFIRQLMTWLFRPTRASDRSLAEYVDLSNEFKRLKRTVRTAAAPRGNWQTFVEQLFAHSEIALLGRQYAVPRRWDTFISGSKPPGELARLLLAAKWRCDFQAAKEILVELRKESPIRSAWEHYERWLSEHSEGIRELRTIICRNPAVFRWPRTWPTS